MIDFDDKRYQGALALILELGFICAMTGASRERAEALVEAHRAARPAGRGHVLGEALIKLCCEAKPEEAVAVLRRSGLDYQDPDEDPEVVAVLSLILMQAGYNSEATRITDYLLGHTDNARALSMARGIQEQMASPA